MYMYIYMYVPVLYVHIHVHICTSLTYTCTSAAVDGSEARNSLCVTVGMADGSEITISLSFSVRFILLWRITSKCTCVGNVYIHACTCTCICVVHISTISI